MANGGFPLHKMTARADGPAAPGMPAAVHYALKLGAVELRPEEFIGRPFSVRFTGVRTCVRCGREVKKLFGDGLCFPCFRDAPEAAPCIIRPELCEAHLGKGRDVQWERAHHLQEHVVYLSFTGNSKVGVTRSTQVPVRWIDQGATLALPIARVPYRQLAGLIEVDLKRHFSDRTDWRRMLLLDGQDPDAQRLLEAREAIAGMVAPELRQYLLADGEVVRLGYPLRSAPPKLVAVQLEKLPEVEGQLQGIKGQYLVWKDGRVLNVRSHSGFHVVVIGS